MPITVRDVEHIATLAKLEFSSSEKEQLVTDLNAMIGHIDRLNEVDTTGVEPLATIGEGNLALRTDEVQPSPSMDEMLVNAPERDGAFFQVPSAIQRKTP